jgi:hypothetical protein
MLCKTTLAPQKIFDIFRRPRYPLRHVNREPDATGLARQRDLLA